MSGIGQRHDLASPVVRIGPAHHQVALLGVIAGHGCRWASIVAASAIYFTVIGSRASRRRMRILLRGLFALNPQTTAAITTPLRSASRVSHRRSGHPRRSRMGSAVLRI
jgi:hypothetical protein